MPVICLFAASGLRAVQHYKDLTFPVDTTPHLPRMMYACNVCVAKNTF
jgi:hypothetical protein